jgi:hypothetical protein
MHRTPPKFALLGVPAVLAGVLIGGCGGGSMSLTGGSVPIGGRAITGTAVLPGSIAAANATVTAKALPAGTSISKTRTDGSGGFTLSNIPGNTDIDIVVATGNGGQLEIIVPRSALSGGMGPLNIGNVDANSSLVAAALRLEQAPAPEDSDSIVGNQQPILDHQVQNGNFSQQQLNQLIYDPDSMNAQALALMAPAANASISTLQATPSQINAGAALNSLLGYLRAAHTREFHMSADVRQSLLNSAAAGTVFTPDQVAAALASAGIGGKSSAQVSAASTRERSELTAFAAYGSGISALEALVLAADVNTNGGFQCNQNQINNFLQALIGNG